MPREQSSLPIVALLAVLLVLMVGTVALLGSPVASVLSEPPRVSLDITQNVDAGPEETAATVTFTHDGGDELPAAHVYVVIDGQRAADHENLTVRRSAATFDIGERIVVEQTAPGGLTGGEELQLVYERGDTQFRLRTVTVDGENEG